MLLVRMNINYTVYKSLNSLYYRKSYTINTVKNCFVFFKKYSTQHHNGFLLLIFLKNHNHFGLSYDRTTE